jgi:hypothetical protein
MSRNEVVADHRPRESVYITYTVYKVVADDYCVLTQNKLTVAMGAGVYQSSAMITILALA